MCMLYGVESMCWETNIFLLCVFVGEVEGVKNTGHSLSAGLIDGHNGIFGLKAIHSGIPW